MQFNHSYFLATHVDAPEFFDRIKCHDLFQELVPVVALNEA